MFDLTIPYYDKIYAFKDYKAEAEKVYELASRRTAKGDSLLDVACGTGAHLVCLQNYFSVEGLDIMPEFLEICRKKLSDTPLHQADMVDFDLGKRFDVITCLFSSIGYVKTLDRLQQALSTMSRHLNPGGILILEPWFTPDAWYSNTVHAVFIDEPDLKIARVNTSFQEGMLSIFDLHYLIGTPQGTLYAVEHHVMGLFTCQQHIDAFRSAGLEPVYDEQGLTGRGAYLGFKQA